MNVLSILKGIRELFRQRRVLKSGTTEHPKPTDVFRALIYELVESEGEWGWVHFDASKSKHWVEVAWDKDYLFVNFSFLFNSKLTDLLSERDVAVPPTWQQEYFKKKKAATFRAPKNDLDTIIAFVDSLFCRVFECGRSYWVVGSLQS